MILDILIVLFLISAIYRGREIGFARQLLATSGFFGGLFLGAWLQPIFTQQVTASLNRALLGVIISIGCALGLLVFGEYLGLRIKQRVLFKPINRWDIVFGGIINVVSTLFAVWLLAALAAGLPSVTLQDEIHNSRIIHAVDGLLPPAPGVIARLGKLIDPNGFPQVFIGNEPAPGEQVNLPSLGDLAAAVQKDEASVVKIQGLGCGGIVDGSGFVVGKNLVATNAHVVAGIARPYVQDMSGTHRASAVYFNPNEDFALLSVSGSLNEPILHLASSTVNNGSPAAVMGYPGGGPFTANPAAVIDTIIAEGRNIYGTGRTVRQVYELQASVQPGNSGGPLVSEDGSVIGVVFAESTTYQNVGYALTSPALTKVVNQTTSSSAATGTGQCAQD